MLLRVLNFFEPLMTIRVSKINTGNSHWHKTDGKLIEKILIYVLKDFFGDWTLIRVIKGVDLILRIKFHHDERNIIQLYEEERKDIIEIRVLTIKDLRIQKIKEDPFEKSYRWITGRWWDQITLGIVSSLSARETGTEKERDKEARRKRRKERG